MVTVSQETLPPQPRRRRRAGPRPYQVVDDRNRLRTFKDLNAATRLAQELADKCGAPREIRDTARGVWLPHVRPAQHRCQNGRCRAPLSAAEFDTAWRNGRCPHCPPAREGA